eukprot:gene8737-5342_t
MAKGMEVYLLQQDGSKLCIELAPLVQTAGRLRKGSRNEWWSAALGKWRNCSFPA